MTARSASAITPSIGNVFADLDLPDADDRLAKAELARQIAATVRERGLTQRAAAQTLGIDQPKVSALLAGRLAGFSLERLAHFLTLLGEDVEIGARDKRSIRRLVALACRSSEIESVRTAAEAALD